ncbi:IS110 family transposase [Deinococcus aquatilis]|uniref:IS110 family transposase n=1 Tax=Deinococcus aquatilis TaxID=519440 RepID=UPI0004771422
MIVERSIGTHPVVIPVPGLHNLVDLGRGKTDTMDAEIIAWYGVVIWPSLWEPPAASAEELKVLVRDRETLPHTLTQEHNRLHALQHRPAASLRSWFWFNNAPSCSRSRSPPSNLPAHPGGPEDDTFQTVEPVVDGSGIGVHDHSQRAC